MASGESFPAAVFVIWTAVLALTLVVFVPVAVFLLHRTWRAAHSIQIYAREALASVSGIAAHTKQIPALDETIVTATEMEAAAEAVERKLAMVADLLAQRAR